MTSGSRKRHPCLGKKALSPSSLRREIGLIVTTGVDLHASIGMQIRINISTDKPKLMKINELSNQPVIVNNNIIESY